MGDEDALSAHLVRSCAVGSKQLMSISSIFGISSESYSASGMIGNETGWVK
jgi:hypothetical protein